MPFTASHVAAALPFRRTPLPIAGVVIGSMAPDLPYFLPTPTFRDLTHEWLGVVTIDLVIGLVAWLIWRVVRAPVLGLAPRWLRTRVGAPDPAPWQSGGRWWASLLLLVAAIVVGNVTHLLLDAPTHPGWVADRIGFLRLSVDGILMTRLLHRGLSVVLAVVIAVWAVRWVRRTPAGVDPDPASGAVRVTAWIGVPVVFVLGALGAWIVQRARGFLALDAVVEFRIARASIGCALAAALVACAAWALALLIRRRRAASADSSVEG